jgi:endonuclease VIII
LPEGDTLHKLAAALSAELCGEIVRHAELRRLDGRGIIGAAVLRVTSVGKHLLIAFDNGLVLRSHLGMYGAWHRYAPAEFWRKPAWQASIVLRTERGVFVCFNAKEAEILAVDGYRLRDVTDRLGPDLIREPVDPAALERRARRLLGAGTPLADVLLDQRVAAGIGNVYKCEVLFIERQSPFARMDETAAEVLERLYATAADLLRRNLGGGPRVTRWAADSRGERWVYRRGGLPCLRCGERIRRTTLGVNQRVTYWCPGCQAASASAE